MKRIMPVLAGLCILAGCTTTHNACTIKGIIDAEDNRDGAWIFLVPAGPHENSDVDSTVIRNGRFKFQPDSEMVAILRVHRDNRAGLQDLLVVTEPGIVETVISADSKGSGTPQNDSLQVWKDLTMELNEARAAAATKKDRIMLNEEYARKSSEMAENLGDCILGRWLSSMFPKHNQ